jgi:transposase
MPAQDDVVAAWNQSHSASALAAHFDVPRHTAQGWLRRLRSMGVIEAAA